MIVLFLAVRCSVPFIENAEPVHDANARTLFYTCAPGFWISPGIFNSSIFTCDMAGVWNPNPRDNVLCQGTSF